MLVLMTGLPDNVIGVRAHGRVSRDDYQSILRPAVAAAAHRHRKLRLLYRLEPDFAGLTPGAVLADLLVAVGHLRAWERTALVTDAGWIRGITRALAFALPGRVRVYTNAELDAALAWICS
jgi:hypothetical protein